LDNVASYGASIIYNGTYLIDGEKQEYKVQLMVQISGDFSQFKSKVSSMIEGDSKINYVQSLDEDITFVSNHYGMPTDYPLHMCRNFDSTFSRRMIVMGSLWDFIKNGIDKYTDEPEITEIVLRITGYIQGIRLKDIIDDMYYKDFGLKFDNQVMEARLNLLSIINKLLRTYGYCSLDLKKIVWDDSKINEITVEDAFFFSENKRSGFIQGLLTSLLGTFFNQNEKKMEDINEFYVEMNTKPSVNMEPRQKLGNDKTSRVFKLYYNENMFDEPFEE